MPASESTGRIFSITESSNFASLSPPFARFCKRWMARSQLSKSARANSVLMVSISLNGSILPATCTMSSFSKQRTTWPMASVSRMLARNLLPKPSPLLAPATKPAISTNSMVVGNTRSGLTISANASKRGSGIGTTPVLGSMVQNG